MNKKIFFFLILIFSQSLIFSQASNLSKTQISKNFFRDFVIFQVTKNAKSSVYNEFSNLPRDFSVRLLHIKWTFEFGPITYFDLIYTDSKGVLESNFARTIDTNDENLANFLESLKENENALEDFQEKIDIQKEEETDSKILSGISNISEEKIKTQSNPENYLAFYRFDDEVLSLDKNKDNRVVINSDGKKSIRSFYDDSLRLKNKETWNMNDFSDSSIVKNEFYYYKDDSLIPDYANIFENGQKTVLFYLQNGNVYKKQIFYSQSKLNKNQNAKTDDKTEKNQETEERYYLFQQEFLKFTENGKIKQKITEKYSYPDIEKSQNFTKTEIKELYTYKDGFENPDYAYFENSKLKQSKEYSSNSDYIYRADFDNNFIVESYYSGGLRKKDLYYQNGFLIRRRVYE